MFKFLHAADIHLDSPQRGLDRYEGAPVNECRGATRRALANLVNLAMTEKVAFVVIVGDLYDGDWPDYNTGLFFGKQMMRLRDSDIPVFMIRGNHDAANRMTKDLKLVDNVHVLSSQQAETVRARGSGSGHPRSELSNPGSPDKSGKILPGAAEGIFQPRASCTPVSMVARGTNHTHHARSPTFGRGSTGYWALGHIHTREILIGMIPGLSFPATCKVGMQGSWGQGLHAGNRR